MNSASRFFAPCLFTLAFSIMSDGLAPGQTVSGPVRGKPIQLFDGTSLQGWSKQNGDTSTNWGVEDGAICWKSKGGDLYHQHWYRDFELTFEWKLDANGNSGIKYRVQKYGKRFLGCEFQIQDDKQNPRDTHSSGALYDLYEPNGESTTRPILQWNAAKIVVCGNRVEHWLNGSKVVEATIGSPDWQTRVADSKFNKHPGFSLNREGRIFLQDHGSAAWFRNLVVTPLDCDRHAQNSCLRTDSNSGVESIFQTR